MAAHHPTVVENKKKKKKIFFCSYDFLHAVCDEQMNEKSVHCSPHTATIPVKMGMWTVQTTNSTKLYKKHMAHVE